MKSGPIAQARRKPSSPSERQTSSRAASTAYAGPGGPPAPAGRSGRRHPRARAPRRAVPELVLPVGLVVVRLRRGRARPAARRAVAHPRPGAGVPGAVRRLGRALDALRGPQPAARKLVLRDGPSLARRPLAGRRRRLRDRAPRDSGNRVAALEGPALPATSGVAAPLEPEPERALPRRRARVPAAPARVAGRLFSADLGEPD